MEDIRSTLENMINALEKFEFEWNKKIEVSFQEIQEISRQPITKPNNKRLKRLQTVTDVETENSLESSVKSGDNRNSTETESVCETSQQTERPKRAAKLKVLENLKEKPLRGKLRQPLNSLSVNDVSVKKEKLSKIPDDIESHQQKQVTKEPQDAEKRKSDESDANKENSKKVDNSLEIVGTNENATVIELSEDEDVGKMPPPTILPPKTKKNRKNKSKSDSMSSTTGKTDSTLSATSKTVKTEKQSLGNNQKTSTDKNNVKDVEVRLEKIKAEKESMGSTKSGKSKKGAGKKVVKPKVIKKEIVEGNNVSEKDNQDRSSISSSASATSVKNSETELRKQNDVREPEISEVRRTTRNASKKKPTSGDSVYEDAVTDQMNNNANKNENKKKDSNENQNGNKEPKSDAVVKVKKLKIPIDSNEFAAKDIVVTEKEIVKVAKTTKTALPLPRKTPPFVEPSPEKTGDATFVSAVSETADDDDPISDATFVKDAAQQTFVVDKQKPQNVPPVDVQKSKVAVNAIARPVTASSVVNSENCNATFSIDPNATETVLSKKKDHDSENDEISQNSLMTEDDSHVEEEEEEEDDDDIPLLKLMPKGKPKPKHKNELFSPFIQSPVKKKVEAFEKHANEAAASPIPQRQTRTKTRLKQLQQQNEKTKETETTEQKQSQPMSEFNHFKQMELNQHQKARTPVIPSRLARILTPTQQTNVTPTLSNPLKKVLPSSTSKLQTLQKAFSSSSLASSKGSSLSQENCCNIEKSQSKSKINQLLEEKKKIREMKIQQVLKAKETRDKEREDRLKKNLELKNEKARKIEVEKRKELQRNLKLYEEAQRKLEKQKLLEYEKVEGARKEKELQERILQAKEQMKMKLYQQQMLYQQQQQQAQQRLLQQQQQVQQKLLQQQKSGYVRPIDKLRYDFDMLNSDDSTDDEGKASAKRPQPPIWSKSSVRQFHIERQTHLPTKIIDSFFSVQPMTPDLQEIFPAIDPRYLKRNSSVVWKTPPRYSELPKY